MFRWRRETTLDIYNIILGAALFAAPWLFSYSHQAARADDWVTGAIIIAFAVGAVVAFSEWEEWISMLLGLWVTVSPWLLGFAHSKAMPVHVAIGLLIMFLSALELWLIHYEPDTTRPDSRVDHGNHAGPATT